MDLRFQVRRQSCSLQHWTLLPSPVTSTAGHCFRFGTIPSCPRELILHSSPVVYWAPTDLRTSSASAIHTVQEGGRRGEVSFKIKPHAHQRCSEGSHKTLCAPGPRDPTETESEVCVSVSCGGMGQQWPAAGAEALGAGDWPLSLWHKPSWRRSPLTPPSSHRADDPQTAEQLYQRNYRTVKKVLGFTRDLPTWGSGKGTENPQGNLTLEGSGI